MTKIYAKTEIASINQEVITVRVTLDSLEKLRGKEVTMEILSWSVYVLTLMNAVKATHVERTGVSIQPEVIVVFANLFTLMMVEILEAVYVSMRKGTFKKNNI